MGIWTREIERAVSAYATPADQRRLIEHQARSNSLPLAPDLSYQAAIRAIVEEPNRTKGVMASRNGEVYLVVSDPASAVARVARAQRRFSY